MSVNELPAYPIENREVYYNTLFQGELPYDPSPDEAYAGIAGLCRTTRKSSRMKHFKKQIEDIPQIVESMLIEHDIAAREEDGEAIFSFLNQTDRSMVSGIVSDIFVQWESTYSKHKLEPLLPDAHSVGQGLVIETAAAVMDINGQYGFKLQKNVSDAKYVTKIIANWGPGFARDWFDGTILNEWADEQQMAPEERAEWSKVFGQGLLKHLAVAYVSDPVEGLNKIKHNLEEVLADDNIAEFLGWPADQVAEVFTPNIRKRIAIHNTANPLRALEAIRYNLEEVLTDESIAECLEIPVEEVSGLIYDSMRRQIAVFYPTDPLKVIARAKLHLDETLTNENIAEFLDVDETVVSAVFGKAVCKYLAFNYHRDPLKACRDWMNGKITLSEKTDAARDRQLAKLAK